MSPVIIRSETWNLFYFAGLCGVFDYNITNDLTRPNGREVSVSDDTKIMANLNVYRPKTFLKGWR